MEGLAATTVYLVQHVCKRKGFCLKLLQRLA